MLTDIGLNSPQPDTTDCQHGAARDHAGFRCADHTSVYSAVKSDSGPVWVRFSRRSTPGWGEKIIAARQRGESSAALLGSNDLYVRDTERSSLHFHTT